jgi:hypothetical protein
MRNFITGAAALLAVLATSPTVSAVVVADADHIYSPLLLSDFTQGCVQSGLGGTFVGQGPGFTGNAQSIVFVTEAGDESVVATGFNAISDCEYDAVIDTLYVTDNSLEAVGAVTGDTVFAIADASTAPGVTALGNELVPAGSLPFAAGVAIDSIGQVFVANANGGGTGSVQRVSSGALVPFIPTGLDFVGSIVFDASGDLLVVETLAGFDSEVTRYSSAGASIDSVAGPSFGFGSYDIAFDVDGRLLVSGAFGGNVVSMNAVDGATLPFASGLTFATGMDVDGFTGRVSLLSATFVPTDEDSSLHRFVAKDRLVTGKGSEKTECTSEVYGLELVPAKPGKPAKDAICVDGAACDVDGLENDVCVFPVGVCLRVSDARLPECTPTDVTSFTLVKSKPESAVLTALAATVAAATPVTEEACFFSDGVPVPVKITGSGAKKDGKAKFKTQAVGSGTKPPKDTDSVKLVCRPSGT